MTEAIALFRASLLRQAGIRLAVCTHALYLIFGAICARRLLLVVFEYLGMTVSPFTHSLIHSLVVVCALHGSTDADLATLHDFATHDHFVQDLVHLVEVENEVQFAYAPEILVQHFHKQVDEFKHG